jgi:photosynthetic reaction center subunit H
MTMVGVNFFGNFDLASLSIWLFWLFFALLIYYLQQENMREGFPLVDEDGEEAANLGLVGPPTEDKTFILRDGRGEVTVPSGQRGDRDDLAMARTNAADGFPHAPTGDAMADGVGPAAWAPRRDVPELSGEGHPKIAPMAGLPEFKISAGRDPRGLTVQAGDGAPVGNIVDLWVDVPEQPGPLSGGRTVRRVGRRAASDPDADGGDQARPRHGPLDLWQAVRRRSDDQGGRRRHQARGRQDLRLFRWRRALCRPPAADADLRHPQLGKGTRHAA